ALTEIKQTQNYTSAVAKLTQAAEKNIDSANLVLAYMYEYGVGVEQDMAKAKEYYAKESSAHNNEFAALKVGSLSDDNNCVVVLPEGCKIKANEYFIDCVDSITMANGNGTFSSNSSLLTTCNFDGEYVNFCYRHPDTDGTTELNSLGTAVTLMMCNVPYAFNLSKEAYNKVREQLLDLPETKQLADEIDRQVLEYGHFDMASLGSFLSKGCKAIYATYGGAATQTKGGTQTQFSGTLDDTKTILVDYVNNRKCRIYDGNEKNEISTTFQSGFYDTETSTWSTVLKIRNISQVCFMAVPGEMVNNEFVNKYDTWYDRLLNGTFVPASKFFDFGGGSLTGFLWANWQYFELVWECCKSDHYSSSADKISLINDIETSIHIWADAQQAYREKYNVQEEVMKMDISSEFDAVKYLYPLHNGSIFDDEADVAVLAYWFSFYFVLPVWDFVAAYYKAEGKDFKMKNFVLNVVKKLMKDKDWHAALQQCISSGNWMDKNADKFYSKTFWAVVECFAEAIDNDNKTVKGVTKAVKSGVEIAQKFNEGKDEEAWVKIGTYMEKTSIEMTDNDWLAAVYQTFDSAEDLITFGSGLVKMLFSDYNSFEVRFQPENQPFIITKSELVKDTKGNPQSILFQVNKESTINVYVNGKMVHTEKNVAAYSSYSYDLTEFEPGDYKISVQAVFENLYFSELKKYDIEFTVFPETPILSSTIYGDTPCDVDDDLSVSITSTIASDISVLVNGKEVGSKNSTDKYSVSLPTDQPGTFNVIIKGKTKYAEAEDITFSYSVNTPDTPVTPSGSLPSVSGTNLESTTSHTGGTAPDVKGQNIDQTYSTGTAPDVKGQNLDDSYSGQGTAPDAKGQKL
ncbi:MAG: sel1 repeat family protein, partial [Bacteroidales bacterium]|nr:sel1 repeat family protein [Bacteroidales bacterium]